VLLRVNLLWLLLSELIFLAVIGSLVSSLGVCADKQK